MGKAGLGRPEDHGHAGLDRHAEPLPPPGRGGPRRLGPRASQRRDADPLAERRDGGDRPAAALAGRVRRADGRPSPAGPRAPGPGGRGGHRARPAGGGLSAGPGPEHQHHGDAGRRRRPGAGRQPDAPLQPRGFRPLPSGRQPGQPAEQGGTPHAAARSSAAWPDEEQTVREVLVGASLPGRRTGAIMLVDAEGQALGHLHRQRSGPAVRASPRRRARSARSAR